MKRITLNIIVLAILALIAAYFMYAKPQLNVLNGYAAKKACSCLYISERSIDAIEEQDLGTSPLNLASLELDEKQKTVRSSVFGLGGRTASYTKGIGCSLSTHNLPKNDRSPSRNVSLIDSLAWPYGSKKAPSKTHGIKSAIIDQAVDLAFDKEGEFIKKTLAFIVIQNDSIVAKKYAPGYTEQTELPGWSMTKSICNMLIGILDKEGRLKPEQTQLFDEWKDERKNISLDNMLRMRSGLQWDEVYSEISDATKMLFNSDDMPAYVQQSPLEFEPGTHFEYSSGTTNLLSLLIRNQFDTHQEYIDFPYEKLFDPLGLQNIVLETDVSGHFVLSSYCFATPREWAKLGLLYLHKGTWNGKEFFTEDWYNYSVSPAENSESKDYGAHVWLQSLEINSTGETHQIILFNGYDGQHVYIIPDFNAVIVRMGLSEGPAFDRNAVVTKVIEGLEKQAYDL